VQRATAAIAAREHEAIVRLARAAEYRDWETGSHIMRVALYTRIIARGLDLPALQRDALFRAAPMHDVGKIGVPDYILMKPSGLDDLELGIMKQHTVIGHQILAGSASDLLRMAAEIALTHHERLDGRGYPSGLSGDSIPLWGRIVAVADTFDALTSERPYKGEWPVGLATAYLRENAGVRFDPGCVTALLGAEKEVAEVRASFPDDHRQSLGTRRPPETSSRHIA
jgi:two-component system, response regulator RpfG